MLVARSSDQNEAIQARFGQPDLARTPEGACCCRKSDPDVTMVQSAEDRQRKNATDRVDRPFER
jgi:hypothetical protein